jgi:hypothetical protein
MKKENIVRMSFEEAEERRRKGISGIDWKNVNAMTDEDIERLALEDNRRHGIRDDWYKGAVRVNGIDELLALHRREQAERCKSGDKKK